MLLLTFESRQMDVRRDKEIFVNLNRVLVRHELGRCAAPELHADTRTCFDLFCATRPLVGYHAGVEVGRSMQWRVNVDNVADQWKLPFIMAAPRCKLDRTIEAVRCADDGQVCACNGTVVYTQARGGRVPGRGPPIPPRDADGFCWESKGSTQCDGSYGDSAPMYRKHCVCRPHEMHAHKQAARQARTAP
jgi:hypothetical protein